MNMPSKKWGVAKVKGIGPEQFFIFLKVHGSSVRASDFCSEQELRSDLENRGLRKTEIRLLIDRARANPQKVRSGTAQIMLMPVDQGHAWWKDQATQR